MTITYEGVEVLTDLQRNMKALDDDIAIFEGLKNSLTNNVSALELIESWETESDETQKSSLAKAKEIILI
jgi:hypothetical protein